MSLPFSPSVFFTKNKNILIAFIACAILIIHTCIWVAMPNDNLIFHNPDSYSYLSVSEHLNANEVRTIGYPLFIYLTKSLFKNNYEIALFIAQLLLVGGVYFIVLSKLFKRNVGFLLLALFFIANPSLIIYARCMLTEVLFTFLLTLYTALHYYGYSRKSTSMQVLAFGVFCLAVLVRPGLLPLCIILLFVYLLLHLKRGNIKQTLLISILFLGLIGSQAYRYQKTFGEYRISMIGDITTYRYFNTKILSLANNTTVSYEMHKADSVLNSMNFQNPKTLRRYMHNVSYQTLQKHPMQAVRAYFENLVSNTHNGNMSYEGNKKISRQVFLITRVFTILSVVLLLFANLFVLITYYRNRISDWPLWWLICVCNYLFFSAGISFWQGDRFVIIWIPTLIFCLSVMHKKNTAENYIL
ncbi:MAG: hypothetical protein R2831_02345 [Chitinophagaceae bacterium]